MIQIFSHTEAGGHAVNEDAFEVRQHPSDPSCFLCALADGQGGRAGGGAAARLACRTCIDLASARQPRTLATRPDVWQSILREADLAVEGDEEAGFTTLVAFCAYKDGICGASNGDSAALSLSAGGPCFVLTDRQLKDPPVGSGAARPVGFSARLVPPRTVLALSDGVWKYVGWDRVTQAASRLSGQELIDALRQQAGLPGSGRLQDDFTVVAFHEGG